MQTQTSGVYSKGNTRKFWPKVTHSSPVDLSVGVIRSQIAAEWLQLALRSQWRTYRKPSSLFRMVPSLTPALRPPLSPKWGFHMPPRYANGHNVRNGLVLGVGFSGSADRMALFPVTSNPRRQAAILDNFEWPNLRNGSVRLYSAHRAVVFAIAQLSCSYMQQALAEFLRDSRSPTKSTCLLVSDSSASCSSCIKYKMLSYR